MTLDDLAPWPRAADQVTAEALVRYFAVVAHASALAGEHEFASVEYATALELRVLQIFAPARADGAAQLLWRRLENPPPEGLTAAFLLKLGIDPGSVAEAVGSGRPVPGPRMAAEARSEGSGSSPVPESCPGSLVAHQGRAGGGDGASHCAAAAERAGIPVRRYERSSRA